MPQVEDVPGPPADAIEDVLGLVEHPARRSQQQRRIEVALHGAIEADVLPRLVNRHAPVHADDVAARLAQLREHRRRPGAEVNRRHATRNRIEDLLRMGKCELAIVGRAQRADPGVEQLHRIDACVDLRAQIVADDCRELVAEDVPRVGMSVHQRLGAREVGRVAAFNRIRSERERRAGEANQRHAIMQLLLHDLDGLHDMRKRLARLEELQPVDVRRRFDRPLDLRAFALHEVEGESHRFERQQQIGKQNRGIHLDAPHRLQRHFGGELRRAADLEQRVLLADGAVLRHVAAGLAHEPDRRHIDGLPPARFEESAHR